MSVRLAIVLLLCVAAVGCAGVLFALHTNNIWLLMPSVIVEVVALMAVLTAPEDG